jgi:uncharacterized membrane protein
MKLADPAPRLNNLPMKIIAAVLVGLVLAIWLMYTPEGLLGKADAVGYAVCHRIDLRSFHLGDRQLPLCVRCSGMFLGALLGLVYQAWTAPRYGGFPPRRVLAVMAVLFLAFAFDGVNSYLHLFPGMHGLYEPHHALRLLTGTGMGLALAMVLYPAYQQTVWRDWVPRPPVGSLRSLAILLGLALAMAGLVWLQHPAILYPAALLSAAGVVILLSMVYSMVAVMVLRMENRSLALSDLALPILCGVGLAFLQIGGIDWLRFLFTGTWDGFHFG